MGLLVRRMLSPLLARLGSRAILGIGGTLFLLNMIIPDPLPLVDEFLMLAGTILLSRWAEQGAKGAGGASGATGASGARGASGATGLSRPPSLPLTPTSYGATGAGRLEVDVGFVNGRPRDRGFSRELDAEIARMEGFLSPTPPHIIHP